MNFPESKTLHSEWRVILVCKSAGLFYVKFHNLKIIAVKFHHRPGPKLYGDL